MSSLIVEPPAIARTRQSSADQAIVEAIAEQIGTDHWTGNGKIYKTHDAASNDAQIYKRAVARAMQVEDHKVRSRVWGVDGKGVVLTDTTKPGTYQFALKHDPSKQKRTRNRASNGS